MRTTAGEEMELQSYRVFARRDLLTDAALTRMLAGLSSRRYQAGLEPIGALATTGTAKSTISQRFVEGTQHKLDELLGRDLSALELVAIFIDGIEDETPAYRVSDDFRVAVGTGRQPAGACR